MEQSPDALVMGQMSFEDRDFLVQQINQPDLLSEQVDRANAATTQPLRLIGHFTKGYCL